MGDADVAAPAASVEEAATKSGSEEDAERRWVA